eukprot:8271708-Pyramimonas_sp.AAC.1
MSPPSARIALCIRDGAEARPRPTASSMRAGNEETIRQLAMAATFTAVELRADFEGLPSSAFNGADE